MTIPSLFLRASETSRPPQPQGMNKPANRDLLVPHVRQGLEFVLHGCMHESCCDLVDPSASRCTCSPIPVRAFELIAGEPGRVKDGQLQRRLGNGQWVGVMDGFPSDAPWREAWESSGTYEYLGSKMAAFPQDGHVWLVGPTVMGNFYGLKRHELRRPKGVEHRPFNELSGPRAVWAYIRAILDGWKDCYGIEFRLGDKPVARVMRSEMGL